MPGDELMVPGVRNGFPWSLCLRLTTAKSRTIGEALGSIIATIISHHMKNMRAA